MTAESGLDDNAMASPDQIALMKEVARIMTARDIPYRVLEEYSVQRGFRDPWTLPKDYLEAFIRQFVIRERTDAKERSYALQAVKLKPAQSRVPGLIGTLARKKVSLEKKNRRAVGGIT